MRSFIYWLLCIWFQLGTWEIAVNKDKSYYTIRWTIPRKDGTYITRGRYTEVKDVSEAALDLLLGNNLPEDWRVLIVGKKEVKRRLSLAKDDSLGTVVATLINGKINVRENRRNKQAN